VKRHRGFTLIELLVALAVIMILAGILFLGARYMTNSTKRNTTRSMLQNLQSMVAERQRAIGATKLRDEMNLICTTANTAPNAPVYDAATKINNVEPGQDQRYPATPYVSGGPVSNNAVGATQYLMVLLSALPANKTIIGQLPKGQFLEVKTQGDPAYNPPILLDGYGNPIILVPTDGIDGVSINGGAVQTISAPNRLPFFASAGPDGDFSKGDDNLYSFEN